MDFGPETPTTISQHSSLILGRFCFSQWGNSFYSKQKSITNLTIKLYSITPIIGRGLFVITPIKKHFFRLCMEGHHGIALWVIVWFMLNQYTPSFVIGQTSSRSIAIDYKTLIIHLDADACFWGRWFKLFDSHQMIVNVNSTIYPCLIYLIWKIRSFKLIKTHSIHKTSIKNMDQEINLHWCSFLKILLIQSIRIVVKLKLSCNIDLIFGFSTSKKIGKHSLSLVHILTHIRK